MTLAVKELMMMMNFQDQKIKVPDNVWYTTELMVHGTAIKVTVMLGGGTMPSSPL